MTPAIHSTGDARRVRDPHGDLAAVILTGGRSTRMGRAKAWLDLGDRPLLLQVARRVRPLVREIVVVAAQDQVLPALDEVTGGEPAPGGGRPPCRITIVRDRVPDLGPLPALALGLATVRAAHAFALACDAPLIQPAVLHLLARERTRARAVIPLWEGHAQPLVAIYSRHVASDLATLIAAGERSLQAILQLKGVHALATERLRRCDPEGVSFRALNTPEDYAAVRAAWTEHSER